MVADVAAPVRAAISVDAADAAVVLTRAVNRTKAARTTMAKVAALVAVVIGDVPSAVVAVAVEVVELALVPATWTERFAIVRFLIITKFIYYRH